MIYPVICLFAGWKSVFSPIETQCDEKMKDLHPTVLNIEPLVWNMTAAKWHSSLSLPAPLFREQIVMSQNDKDSSFRSVAAASARLAFRDEDAVLKGGCKQTNVLFQG